MGRLINSVQLQVRRATSRALSMFGGMALPPTPILEQSMASPSSLNVSRPTTTPFSDATTAHASPAPHHGITTANSSVIRVS